MKITIIEESQMAKQKRKKTTETNLQSAKFTLSTLQQNIIFIVIIIIYLMIMMKPLVIDGLSPKGVDVVASRGQTNMIREFNKENDEESLWNPAIFSGMPIYHRLGAKAFSLDRIINWFANMFSTPFAYYLLGGLGLFTLLRYLKMIPFLSFMGTMFFILMPHYSSLYLEGHFAKAARSDVCSLDHSMLPVLPGQTNHLIGSVVCPGIWFTDTYATLSNRFLHSLSNIFTRHISNN